MRVLTLEEKAVFDAIVAQRKSGKVIGDIFQYDLIEGQQYLHDKNTSIKYAIDHGQQWNIIIRLAKDGIIKIDIMNVYKGGKIAWVFNTDWARKYVQMSMSDEDCYKKYGCRVFINISLMDIKVIYETCCPAYKATLSVDKTDSLTLIVNCAGYNCHFKAFDNNGRPYQVFMYAYKRPGKLIKSDVLSKEVNGVAEDEYMASGIFLKNTTIKEVLSDFVYLKEPHGIRVDKEAELTVERFKMIKTAAKSVTVVKKK